MSETIAATQLGEAFEMLIQLHKEVKQAWWAAPTDERRRDLKVLMLLLREQAATIDLVEQHNGGRAPWVSSPTGLQPRNIAVEAAGEPERMPLVLADRMAEVVADLRHRAALLDCDHRALLGSIAHQLELRFNT